MKSNSILLLAYSLCLVSAFPQNQAANGSIWVQTSSTASGFNTVTTQAGTVNSSGTGSGATTLTNLAAGTYTQTLFWATSAGVMSSTFLNGSKTGTFSVGNTPTYALFWETRDALDTTRSITGITYSTVYLIESYGANAPYYSAADRYGFNLNTLTAQITNAGTVRLQDVLVSINNGWTASATNYTATPPTGVTVPLFNGGTPTVGPAGSESIGCVYSNGVTYVAGPAGKNITTPSTTVCTVYGTPSASFAGPSGTTTLDPLVINCVVTLSNLYPVNFHWIAITFPDGTVKYIKGNAAGDANTGVSATVDSSAPSTNPTVATSHKSGSATISFNLGKVMSGTTPTSGTYTITAFTKTPCAVSTNGGYGTDQIGATSVGSFVLSLNRSVNGVSLYER